jgi:XTP/dITP diphosphohydrolase
MLVELRGVAAERRAARYQCVIVLVRSADDAAPLIAQGTWEGRILDAPRGTGGFGYDPIFQPAGMNVTAAELAPADKNARSHRGQALRALAAQLQDLRS